LLLCCAYSRQQFSGLTELYVYAQTSDKSSFFGYDVASPNVNSGESVAPPIGPKCKFTPEIISPQASPSFNHPPFFGKFEFARSLIWQAN